MALTSLRPRYHALMLTVDVSHWLVDTVIKAFQFDPESDPDGEAPDEEVATQRLLGMGIVTVLMVLLLLPIPLIDPVL